MNILLVVKQSKYEWEKEKFSLSHDKIVKKYSKERANINAILSSYERQLEVRNMVKSIIPYDDMCFMADAPKYLSNGDYDLVMVLGGDNSFTFVSHSVKDTPILGVNSDPGRSVGCLTRWAINSIEDVSNLVTLLTLGKFDIQKWTRIEATIDGNPIVQASNEYYFGERMANKMSRHVLVYKGIEYEQKSSGIIIASGAGSTGWYNSAWGGFAAFDPTEDRVEFIVREMYSSVPSHEDVYHGHFFTDEEIVLYSLNDDEGMVSVDSWEEFPFTRGSEARIRIGQPLNVVVPHGLVAK